MSLQEDLNSLYNWAVNTGMEFNSTKFELLRFWASEEDKPNVNYLAPNGDIIEEKASLRDLGVRVSSNLSFTEQIEMAAKAGERMSGWALRTFRGRGKLLMLTVLQTLIQPQLDYCSQLWSPRDQGGINRLEAVQKQFISKIKSPELNGKDYWEKLSALRVYSQECRRERYQICLLWKQSQDLAEGFKVKWQWTKGGGDMAYSRIFQEVLHLV